MNTFHDDSTLPGREAPLARPAELARGDLRGPDREGRRDDYDAARDARADDLRDAAARESLRNEDRRDCLAR